MDSNSINDQEILAHVLSLWGTDDLSRLKERFYQGKYPCRMPDKNASPADLPWIIEIALRYTDKKAGTNIEEGWNIKGVYAVFTLAFALISEETKAVIEALYTGDRSRLDAPFGIEVAPEIDSIRGRVLVGHLEMLECLHDQVKYWQFSRPLVKYFGSRSDLVIAANQRYELTNRDRYNDQDYRDNITGVFLRLNPYAPVDVLCEQVRKIIIEYQIKMVQEHEEDWSESEREFYGNDYIDSMNPVKEFDYRRGVSGKKTESLEALLTTWGKCLQACQYRQSGMNPVDIARRMKPKEFDPDSTSPGYKRACEDTRLLLKYADNLISAALANRALCLVPRLG